jgi:hypothetical protein
MARTANQSRVYLVKRGTVESLIRAGSKSAAIAHVMSDVSAEIATQDEIISALSAGGKVEEAAEPEAKPAAEPEAEPAAEPAPDKPAKGKK